MKRPRVLFTILVLVLFPATVHAATGDWRDVQSLPRGAVISVKTAGKHQFRFRYYFQYADDNVLVCERIYEAPIHIGRSKVTFDRGDVVEVRLHHSENENATAGALIGAGTGAALGASATNGAQNRLALALIVGSVGFFLGRQVGQTFPILPSELIYKR
jgi:hypothetical protein